MENETELKDERNGKPSASSIERLALCPGSFHMCVGIKETTSSAAERGNRIHAILAGDKVENQTADEKSSAATCTELAENVIETTIGVPVGDCDEVWREHRLWSADLRFSGKPDLVVIEGMNALIVDYKTGGGAVASASENIQLRALAVLVLQNTSRKLDTITVCIIQPMAAQRITVCSYSRADLVMETDEVYSIIAAAEDPNALRQAGEVQCRYCPARSRCPEANSEVSAIAVRSPISITALTADQLGERLDTCKVAEAVIDAIRDEASIRLSVGEVVTGWRLKPGVERETIRDATTVMSRFLSEDGTEAAFLTTVSVGKGALKVKLGEATGLKGKQLDAKMDELLDGCVEVNVTKPSLAREKGMKL